MDLDQLRTFDRIVRERSFTRAAAHLNITQATASMRMRALEGLLGVKLFQRGRTVTLTDQGMTFLPFARRIIGTTQEGREALRRVERGPDRHRLAAKPGDPTDHRTSVTVSGAVFRR